ncbi:MAG: glycosyltransferase [Gammaproteobacteria bacterium]|nr:glycosyltransferase [Gammaproteobacteria bacterium]
MISILFWMSAFIWLVILILPWKPWRTTETLESGPSENPATANSCDFSDITVVIPARNEEYIIDQTLRALVENYSALNIIVVDDNSVDQTANIVDAFSAEHNVTLVRGKPLKKGWSGKLWAQQQAVEQVTTGQILFLDADITLKPGILYQLVEFKQQTNSSLVSLMVTPSMQSEWERLLMPAFIYFFKFLYPFHLSNQPASRIAAAAGGCILVDKSALDTIGGLNVIKNALIDDCSLAKAIKSAGFKTWTGLTRSAWSHREYTGLREIWDMVARTAYTQLMYSISLLLACTLMMLVLFIIPVSGLFFLDISQPEWIAALSAVILMAITYTPTLSYYNLSVIKALELPFIALMYLMMTWHSAVRYFSGERSRWKGRIYETT